MNNSPIEALEFVRDALTRINDGKLTLLDKIPELQEELEDMQNNVASALAESDKPTRDDENAAKLQEIGKGAHDALAKKDLIRAYLNSLEYDLHHLVAHVESLKKLLD
jgi:hypothetical protein